MTTIFGSLYLKGEVHKIFKNQKLNYTYQDNVGKQFLIPNIVQAFSEENNKLNLVVKLD